MAKCADGATWQGQIDPKTPLLSIADVLNLQSLCYAAGVAFAPVVVPRGEEYEDEVHAAIAKACGCLVVDIESGSGFYDQAPTSEIPGYWQSIRTLAPDAWLVSQPDPRNLDSVYDSESRQHFDAYSAQHYVGWTDVGWNDVVKEVQRYDTIAANGKDCYPILYGTGDAATVSTFWRAIRDYAQGVAFFSLGTIGPSQFETCRGLKLPGEPV